MRIGIAPDTLDGGFVPDLAPVKDGAVKPYRWWRRALRYVLFAARLAPWWAAPLMAMLMLAVVAAPAMAISTELGLAIVLAVPVR